jgi:hypothetical protein
MSADALLLSLFDGSPHPLADTMAGWLSSSRRLTAFVTANQPKIRKKIRSAQDPESLRDVRLEFETAYLLLREHALSLIYEPPNRSAGRSPDFAVSYTTSLEFMLEVTRLRAGGPLGDRFSSLLCSKLDQLLPARPNLLLIGMDAPPPSEGDVHAAMLRLQQRAEANDPGVIQRQGFRDRPDFFQHYQRLSAVLLRRTDLQAGEAITLWNNPRGRYPLPSKVKTALYRSHTL